MNFTSKITKWFQKVFANDICRKGLLIVLLLFGYNIKTPRKWFILLYAFYCVIIIAIGASILQNETALSGFKPVLLCHGLEYLTTVLFSFFGIEYLPKFLMNLKTFDSLVGYESNHFSSLMYSFITVSLLYIVFLHVMVSFTPYSSGRLHYETLFLLALINIGQIGWIFIMEQVLLRMKYVKQNVFGCFKNTYMHQTIDMLKLKDNLSSYKLILNNLEEVDWPLKLRMILYLLIALVRNLIELSFIWKLKDLDKVTYILATASGLVNTLRTMLPCFLKELIATEIESTTTKIIQGFASAEKEVEREALKDALQFLRHNPLRITMWRLFPLDIALVINFVTLLTNLLIIAVQFLKIA